MPPETEATTQPAATEPKQPANSPAPTTVWQSPENALVPVHGKMYKLGIIAVGVLIFFGLAIILAFI